jgi:pyridoxal phosphate enzyme (YggS family)
LHPILSMIGCMLDSNLNNFYKNLHKSLSAAGRPSEHVKVLLATKTVTPAVLKQAVELGQTYFGENRVQELVQKQHELSGEPIIWDFIGHLQSNKVKEIIGKVNLIHSVDRLTLATEIQKQAEKQNLVQKILIEVNTSLETSKSGADPQDWLNLATAILTMPNLKISGLMTIAANTDNETRIRQCFKDLYNMRNTLAGLLKTNKDTLELSMGMSSDYELAIEEGATILRVGSLVFGARPIA